MKVSLGHLLAGISYSRHTALNDKDFHISSLQPSFFAMAKLFSILGRTLSNNLGLLSGVT